MALFKPYRPGQALGREQVVRLATRVTLLEDNPEAYERQSLETLAQHSFTLEEWLLATDDYLVYRTETGVVEHLRRVLLRSTRRLAPPSGGRLLDFLASQVDTEQESTLWLHLRGAQARPWAFEGRAPALLGSKPTPFHYYEIRVGGGALFFLQQPVGHKNARRDFRRFSEFLRRARRA